MRKESEYSIIVMRHASSVRNIDKRKLHTPIQHADPKYIDTPLSQEGISEGK